MILLGPQLSLQPHILFSLDVLALPPRRAALETVPQHLPQLSCRNLGAQSRSVVFLGLHEACHQYFAAFDESSASCFPMTQFDGLRTRVSCRSSPVPLTRRRGIHGADPARRAASVRPLLILGKVQIRIYSSYKLQTFSSDVSDAPSKNVA